MSCFHREQQPWLCSAARLGSQLAAGCWIGAQAGVSRGKAVRALKAADGDIVSAIMWVQHAFCARLRLPGCMLGWVSAGSL
jgi:hypothetical protein